jgi:hypothetical protein
VAGANKFSMSQQSDIFDYFSKFTIYNCVIISKEHKQIDKGYNRLLNVNNINAA